MASATELACKAAITALLLVIFAFTRSPTAIANERRGLAVAVVAVLALFIIGIPKKPEGRRKVLAYSFAIAALLGLLGWAIAFRY